MLCEKCNKNEASVHTVTIINGEKTEQHLCNACAMSAQYTIPSIMELLSGFGMAPQMPQACQCDTSFMAFQKTGLLGCPHCYGSYSDLLIPVIKRAQGGRIRHVGRRPLEYNALVQAATEITKNQHTQELTSEQECAKLRHELREAVQAEHYERAAELRDRLRMLEGGKQA